MFRGLRAGFGLIRASCFEVFEFRVLGMRGHGDCISFFAPRIPLYYKLGGSNP